jgi:NAD(P)H-nitrite reductase large subunit
MASVSAIGGTRVCGRTMTRCECTGYSFDEIARRIEVQGQTLEAVQRETGCGRLCTACVPDLAEHLAARQG